MGYYSRSEKMRKQLLKDSVVDENGGNEHEVDYDLLRLMRFKLKKVDYSLEFEYNGYILLNENGYLCTKGSLEVIDKFCVSNDIYREEDRTSSTDELIMDKKLKSALQM